MERTRLRQGWKLSQTRVGRQARARGSPIAQARSHLAQEKVQATCHLHRIHGAFGRQSHLTESCPSPKKRKSGPSIRDSSLVRHKPTYRGSLGSVLTFSTSRRCGSVRCCIQMELHTGTPKSILFASFRVSSSSKPGCSCAFRTIGLIQDGPAEAGSNWRVSSPSNFRLSS